MLVSFWKDLFIPNCDCWLFREIEHGAFGSVLLTEGPA